MPEVPDLYRLLSEAERQSGRIIEQPWFLMDTFQTYSLTVEFEPSQKVPIWTLCEALDDNYRLIWTCRDTDMYLLHDILSMFMSQGQPAPAASRRRREPSGGAGEAGGSGKPFPDLSEERNVFRISEYVGTTKDLEQNDQPAASVEDKPGRSPQETAPAPEAPLEQASSAPAVEAADASTKNATEGAPDSSPPPDGGIQSKTAEAPQEAAQQAAEKPMGQLTYFERISPAQLEELKQKPNLLLGRLLVESGAIPEGLLEAALKLQEMVRIESLTPDQSIDAMRRAYHRTAAETKADTGDAGDSSEGKLVSELLYEAGIISREDIEAACKLKAKRGGELEILISSGKIDKLVQDAAVSCLRFMHKGCIRHEQAVIALNYCSRSRVVLREAFIDLGWDYPYQFEK
jgi:hypothetical protein